MQYYYGLLSEILFGEAPIVKSYDMPSSANVLIYTCPASTIAFVRVNVNSKNGINPFTLYFSNNSTAPVNVDYIECLFPVMPGGALQRDLILGANDCIWAYTTGANSSVEIYFKEESA
jgi:hypothetical protein